MKIGILTGGGDTPSLNAVIYGAALRAEELGHTLVGALKGWDGVLNPVCYQELNPRKINPNAGGTLLKTSRTRLKDESLEQAVRNIEEEFDALIAIGGDDTLTVGKNLGYLLNIPICFVTKTIDNDAGRNAPQGAMDYAQIINYFTSGFATAARKAAQYAAELRTTAYSHERVIFLETMGRTPGWLALSAYLGGPDFILVPEVPLDFERFKGVLADRYKRQQNAIVVVAEGVKYAGSDNPIAQDESDMDTFGHKKLGGVAEILAERVKKELGIKNSNSVNPGYLYRSGSPSDVDRRIGILLGREAVSAISKKRSGEVAVVYRNDEGLRVRTMPVDEVLLTDSTGHIIPRNLDSRFYNPNAYSITPEGVEYFRPILNGGR